VNPLTRRSFLAVTGGAVLTLRDCNLLAGPQPSIEPVIDIHQHQGYNGRTDSQLVAHQRSMGITTTVVLPSARAFDRKEDGTPLDAERARLGGNDHAAAIVEERPQEFVRFANELPSWPTGPATIEQQLSHGACGIGESKFEIPCDSPQIERLAEIAQAYQVPLLMHFQHGRYNTHFERFGRVLRKFPKVNFIGHAQTFWGNIDLHHDQEIMYPKGPVTAGGLTDRYLSEYPNMYGDLSAGSGLNALIRDEDHTRGFLERHQDKLMFGSDCADTHGITTVCTGAKTLLAVRELAASKEIARKILYGNAQKLLRLESR